MTKIWYTCLVYTSYYQKSFNNYNSKLHKIKKLCSWNFFPEFSPSHTIFFKISLSFPGFPWVFQKSGLFPGFPGSVGTLSLSHVWSLDFQLTLEGVRKIGVREIWSWATNQGYINKSINILYFENVYFTDQNHKMHIHCTSLTCCYICINLLVMEISNSIPFRYSLGFLRI